MWSINITLGKENKVKGKSLVFVIVVITVFLALEFSCPVFAQVSDRPATVVITGRTSYGVAGGYLWIEIWKDNKIVFQGWQLTIKENSRLHYLYYEGSFPISQPGLYIAKVSMEMGCETEGTFRIQRIQIGRSAKVQGPCYCPCENIQPSPGYFPYPPDKLRNR